MSTAGEPHSRYRVKVVVAGAYGAGKTTFISTVADGGTVATETVMSPMGLTVDPTTAVKRTTTVAMDYGRVVVADGQGPVEMMLFGIPGQERFRFMWHVLAQGSLGYVLLVDADDPGSWRDTVMIDATLAVAGVPRVLAVNRLGGHTRGLADLADLLGMPSDVPVVACDPRDRASAIDALLVLLGEVVRTHDMAAAPAAPG